MNNIFLKYLTKAGIIACLFLFHKSIKAQEWAFTSDSKKAYDHVLNLELENALTLIPDSQSAEELYVVSLAETLELLLTEDGEKFTDYEEKFRKRLERKVKTRDVDEHFLQAELYLQAAFVYLKFGHELDAALNFREAYLHAQDVAKRFPGYKAIRKTTGLIEIIIGSIPEKYNWVLGLLNMRGSVDQGLQDLKTLAHSNSPFSLEGKLLLVLTQSYVLQQTDSAFDDLSKHIQQDQENRLMLFVGAAIALKKSSSEKALELLDKIEGLDNATMVYTHYLRGEALLHKGEYEKAINAYKDFIKNFRGQNQIKDALYKTGLCYYLSGKKNDAYAMFNEARKAGKEESEADKHAARSLAETELPNVELTKARYATDGGYYAIAEAALNRIKSVDLLTLHDKVEYTYRTARLAHKQNQIESAITNYKETIRQSGMEPWYFAPNACLQLGYIYQQKEAYGQAENFFKQALTYKKHVYKNSIDSKAKSALAHLRSVR